MFAVLYEALGKAPYGFSPVEVDAMEPWQAASVLGKASPRNAEAAPPARPKPGELRPGMVPMESLARPAATGSAERPVAGPTGSRLRLAE